MTEVARRRPSAAASSSTVDVLRDLQRFEDVVLGEQTGDETDKFAQCDWDEGPAGVPVLRGCRGWVAGRIARQLDLGDHNGFLLDIVDGESRDPSQQPLSFSKLPPLDAGHDA
jgi:flavin reductase (DIM6/NTAB) family NADH-FMN oxidoreductase RutF